MSRDARIKSAASGCIRPQNEVGWLLTLFLIAAFVFLGNSKLLASVVEKERAVRAALSWLKTDNKPLGSRLGSRIQKTDTFSDANGQPMYHVLHLEPQGFVIASADDLVEPIICFAGEGVYSPSADNPLGDLVTRDIPARIESARRNDLGLLQVNDASRERVIKAQSDAKAKWSRLAADVEADSVGVLDVTSVSDLRVEPLIKSEWGQQNIGGYADYPACYNYYTPPYESGNNQNYPCGCVATSMVQLMRYYQYPSSYTWSLMPLVPDLSTTELQRQTIGQLCYDAAVAIDTEFSASGSSATLYAADQQFIAEFDYTNSIYASYPSVGTVLNNMINTNLDAAKSVLLGLSGSSGGHAVVCDGYGYDSSTLYHHLNMGWDGLDNIWYNLPDVEAYYTFDTVVCCVYNVFTSGTGEILSSRVTNMTGEPVPQAYVTAKATGTSTYTATTNNRGIFAIANLPSSKTYTVTATKSPFSFDNKSIYVGKSLDMASTSGNVWASDFVSKVQGPPITYNMNIATISGTTETIALQAADDDLPDPPAQIKYIITQLPIHGILTDPQTGVIRYVPYTIADNNNVVEYKSCSYFIGPDSFAFKADDYGSPPQAGESSAAVVSIDVNNIIYTTFAPSSSTVSIRPLMTSHHQGRTQVIYLAADIGREMIITDIAIDIKQAAGQDMNNWTIRMKHTSRTAYTSSPYYETAGWTVVFQNDEPATPIGWRNFHLQNTFAYNGTDNLMVDFSFNNSSGSTDGICQVSNRGTNRVLYASANSTYGDPLDWSDATAPSKSLAQGVPNIKIIGQVPYGPLAGDFEPDCDVDNVDLATLIGAWLSETGQPGFDDRCDIFQPADGKINFLDLALLADNWLIQVP